MKGSRRAVIDIGTNSVKLLVAEVCGPSVLPVLEKSEQTRLGAGFFETSRLQAEAMERTASSSARFAEEAREAGAESVRIVATSAARDASNRDEFCQAVLGAAGQALEVISGEQEAEWVYRGVASDPSLQGRPLLVMDVGGGSTEFIVGRGAEKFYQGSFPLGSVRLLEQCQLSDPPGSREWEERRQWITAFLNREVAPALKPALARLKSSRILLAAAGGTPSILAAMRLGLAAFDRAAIEGVKISYGEIWYQLGQLWSLPLEERRKIRGLPSSRADVILMGAAILGLTMEQFGLKFLRPSTRGIRFAALLDG